MEPSELRALVAVNIRAIAKRKRVTLTRLADFASVGRAHLFNFLSGEKDVTLGWLSRIATALEVEPADLLRPAPKRSLTPTRKARS